jgi:hypothetical protein
MSIKILAERFATAEADLTAAKASHTDATERADAIRSRIAEKEQRRNELATRRINGSASPTDDAELILLASDIPMLQEALTEAEQAIPSITLQQAIVDRCRHELENTTAVERMAILKAKASEADALLVKLLGEIQQAGDVNLSQLWMPSRALHVLITREFPPA